MRSFVALAALGALFISTLAIGETPRTALPAPVEGHEVTEIGPGYYTFRYKGLRKIGRAHV